MLFMFITKPAKVSSHCTGVFIILSLFFSGQAQAARKYSGRVYPVLIPEHVGFCENRPKKKVNKHLMVDGGENLDFKIDLQKMLRGKFHLAIRMMSPSELKEALPLLSALSAPEGGRKFLNKGLLLVNKTAFLMEEKSPSFYDPAQLNKAEIIEQVQHGTEVLSRSTFESRLLKTIKGNVTIGDKTVQFDQRITTTNGKKWSGFYQTLPKAPGPSDSVKLFAGLEKDWGIPHHVMHFDIVNPDSLLTGGKSVFAFYTCKAGRQIKTLVIAYNIISVNIENPLVTMVLKWFRHLFYKNIKREVGQSVDGYRLWHNTRRTNELASFRPSEGSVKPVK